jgi:hypothetical protein
MHHTTIITTQQPAATDPCPSPLQGDTSQLESLATQLQLRDAQLQQAEQQVAQQRQELQHSAQQVALAAATTTETSVRAEKQIAAQKTQLVQYDQALYALVASVRKLMAEHGLSAGSPRGKGSRPGTAGKVLSPFTMGGSMGEGEEETPLKMLQELVQVGAWQQGCCPGWDRLCGWHGTARVSTRTLPVPTEKLHTTHAPGN